MEHAALEPVEPRDERPPRAFEGRLDVRSAALLGLLVLAVIHTLAVARSVLLPITIALLGNVALTPVVRRLARHRVPESVGAALVLLVVLGALGTAGTAIVTPASRWMDRLPEEIQSLEWKLRPVRKPLEALGEATESMEEATRIGPGRNRVEVHGPGLTSWLLNQTGGFLSSLGVIVVLLYFLLASGERFLRKMVDELARLHQKVLAVEVVRAIEGDVARYLLTIGCVNLCLGTAVGATMSLLGMPNPLLWGTMAAVLNFVPYLGALVGIGVVGAVALLSFETVVRIAAPPIAYALLTTFEGFFVTPYLVGRRLLLSPVAILVSLMLWTWLWGFAGALVAVPILVAVKVACERVKALRPVATLLAR